MKTSPGLVRVAAWILLTAGSAIAAEPEEAPRPDGVRAAGFPSDALILTGGFNRVSSAADGGSASLDWVHLTWPGKTYTAGVEVHSIGNSRWSFAKISAPLLKQERGELRIRADLGGGKTVGEDFPYQIYEASASYQAARRLYLTLNEQYLRIGDARGHLLKPGAMLLLSPRLTAEGSFARSIAGNIQTQFAAGRLDLAAQPVGIFGGVVIGHTAPEIVKVGIGNGTPGQDLREAYFGVRLRFQEIEWTVVADFPDLGTNRQQTLTVGVKLPLRRSGQDSR